MSIQSEEQSERPQGSLTLNEICREHRLSISRVAQAAFLPLETIYRILIKQPVKRWEAEAALGGISQLTDIHYTLDLVAIALTQEEGAPIPPPQDVRMPPFHQIIANGKIVYQGDDWGEAMSRFYSALSCCDFRRIIHMVEATSNRGK